MEDDDDLSANNSKSSVLVLQLNSWSARFFENWDIIQTRLAPFPVKIEMHPIHTTQNIPDPAQFFCCSARADQTDFRRH